ncbi:MULTISPECIES: acyltransferase family protein [Citricoccus]|uniref:acyltransferase family protein n=1 Tax=Citricoccus TaxID=169133 RepID=UPI000255F1E1|nr:acyltransferase family protein [Citricoccus sp. CH26A]
MARGVPERHYRTELHGVRGVAILGVVLFHLFGHGRVSGGIDIFLAVSGYLFTAMLLREAAERDGRIDVLRYLGRLARRILVPAATVVAAVTAIGVAVLPSTRHDQLWAEARASLLYFENIELINSQLAYGAAGPETSPFQHFWSLSVQGQFYLVWPLVAIAAVALARRLRIPAVRVMAVAIGLVLVASLSYAIHVGGFNQDKAYLLSTTRAWELAFGGLLSLLGAGLTLPRRLRFWAGWLGVVLIVSCGFVLDGASLFPGLWSLWPLLGLTLVLASAGPRGGHLDPGASASRILSAPAFAWVGDRAYALYLWHWPLLIYYLEVRDRQSVGWLGAAFILALSLVLAGLTHRFIETPLQNAQARARGDGWRRLNTVSVGTAIVILVAGGTVSTVARAPASTEIPRADHWDWQTHPGGSLTAGDDVQDADYVPSLDALPNVRPDYYDWDCRQPGTNDPGTSEISVCEDPAAPEKPSATVVLAGGSHAGQWSEAFRPLAARHGWELLVVDRSGCPFGESSRESDDTMCFEWQDNFIDWLGTDRDIDLVITPGSVKYASQPETVLPDAPRRWEQITSAGPDLLLLRGTPRNDHRVADCLAEGQDSARCGPPVGQLGADNPLENLPLPPGTTTIDVIDHVCPDARAGKTRCDAVVGNVVVWYDNSHITPAFSATMSPVIEEHMRERFPRLFR